MDTLTPRKGGFASPVDKTLGRAGRPFTQLVLEALDANRITAVDVSRYLDLRFDHVQDLRRDWQARYYPLDVFVTFNTRIEQLIKGNEFKAVELVKEEINAVGTPDLVVMHPHGSKRARAVEIYGLLAGMGVAKDVIVVTPEEFKAYRDAPGTVIRTARQEGKVLYDRAA